MAFIGFGHMYAGNRPSALSSGTPPGTPTLMDSPGTLSSPSSLYTLRAVSAPPLSLSEETNESFAALPAIVRSQLEKILAVPRRRFSASPPPEGEKESVALLVTDALQRAERSERKGKFSPGKSYVQTYRPGEHKSSTGTFTLGDTKFVYRDREGALFLLMNPPVPVAEDRGSEKRVAHMRMLPLTFEGEVQKVVVLKQPKEKIGEDGEVQVLPPLKEEYQKVVRLARSHGPLFVPYAFFSSKLPHSTTLEIVPHYCGIQNELAFMKLNRPSDFEGRLRSLRSAAEGLRILHENSLVHRDVKPANMVSLSRMQRHEGGLSDFGETMEYRRRDSASGEWVPLHQRIGHLDMSRHAPEVILFKLRMQTRIIPGFSIGERDVRKFILGADGEPPLVPIALREAMSADLVALRRFCTRGTPKERENKIPCYFGPAQDIYMLGKASLEVLGHFVPEPEDGESSELREFLLQMMDRYPERRPSAAVVVDAFSRFIDRIGRKEGEEE